MLHYDAILLTKVMGQLENCPFIGPTSSGIRDVWYRINFKVRKLEIFKIGKMLIKIINCHKGSDKPKKFFRSQMTKRTASLNSSRKI